MPDDEPRNDAEPDDEEHPVGENDERSSDEPADEAEGTPEGPAADDLDEDELEPLAVPMWKLVVGGIAVVAVVVVAILAALALLGDDEADDDGPSADDEASVVDSFDRADAPNELGATESGQPWEAVSGVWGVEGEQAVLVEPNPDGVRSIAVVDIGAPDGTISATAGTLTQGWGLVFRYQGPFNYWFLTAAPEFATYNLARVVDGEVQNLGSIGLADIEDGAVVQVRMSGATIEISVDGTPVKAVTDTGLIGATQAGLLASGVAAADATWEAFEATPASPGTGGGAVTPQTVAPAAGAASSTTAQATPTTAAS
jgi:hypothetical protein